MILELLKQRHLSLQGSLSPPSTGQLGQCRPEDAKRESEAGQEEAERLLYGDTLGAVAAVTRGSPREVELSPLRWIGLNGGLLVDLEASGVDVVRHRCRLVYLVFNSLP